MKCNASKFYSDLERKITENQGKTKVHLEIPMFRIVSEIPLLSTLNNIGMTKMFQHAVASFKGKSDFPLYLSDAIHKAIIEVEKTRTEATATAIMGRTKIGPIQLRLCICCRSSFPPLCQGHSNKAPAFPQKGQCIFS